MQYKDKVGFNLATLYIIIQASWDCFTKLAIQCFLDDGVVAQSLVANWAKNIPHIIYVYLLAAL